MREARRGEPALARLFGWLVPARCVLCGRGVEGEAPVCRLCWHRLPRLHPPHCERCGATKAGVARVRPPDDAAAPTDAGEPEATGSCPGCAEWPAGLRAAAPYRMAEGAAALVHAFKYGRWTRLARPMGRSMAPFVSRLLAVRGGPAALVPVPLSPARLRERGFNQAEWLAESLRDAAGWPVARLLERRRTGGRQARLGRRARERNVRGLFSLRVDLEAASRGLLAEADDGTLPLMLVDDVLTTGSTAAACVGVLREAGLECAGVVTFARAIDPLMIEGAQS